MDHDIVRNIILYLLINRKEEFNMPNWCDNYIKIKENRTHPILLGVVRRQPPQFNVLIISLIYDI